MSTDRGRADLELKRRELRLWFWTNTILVGVLGGIVTVIFSLLDVKHKHEELLHQQRQLALNYGELEFRVVGEPLQKIIKDPCGKEAGEQKQYLKIILNAGIVEIDNVGKYEEIARVLTGNCSNQAQGAQSPQGACKEIVEIRKLGWVRGNKTSFCLKDYHGVWNRPNSSYRSGGFCYKGDAPACRAAIEAGNTSL